jgi:hypothetical protein
VKTIGVTGSLSLFLGLNSPPSRNESATAQNVEMTQFALAASTVESVNVRSITVSAFPSGNGHDVTDITAVRLYRDAGGNGLLDPHPSGTGYLDVVLGAGTYNMDNGTVVFGLSHDEIIPANSECSYLVVYDLSGTAVAGRTFVAGVAQNTHIVAEGADSMGGVRLAGAPMQGATMIIGSVGSMIVSYGPANPNPRFVSGPESDVPVLHMTLKPSSIEDIDVSAVTFHGGGTGDDVGTVSATLWEDVDGDGVGDTVLGTPNRVYTQDNGTLTFSGLALSVPASTTRYLVLTYTFNFDPATAWGDTYEVRLIPTLDMQCTGAGSGNTLYAVGSMLFSSRFKVGMDPAEEAFLSLPSGSSGGGCFVATASYGSLQSGSVSQLTRMRDEVLLGSEAGRSLVETYYRLSPPAADALRDSGAARASARAALSPLVGAGHLLVDASAATRVLVLLSLLVFVTAVLALGRRCLRKTA